MAVDELFGGFGSCTVVRAAQVDASDKMAVLAYDVNAIMLHHVTPGQAGVRNSLSPMTAETGAVMLKGDLMFLVLSAREPT